MMQGEAIGARAIGDVRPDRHDMAWPGAWLAGVRPGQAMRVRRRAADARPDAAMGSKIR